MKNLSLVLNVVLIIAVGILYYLHFSQKKPVTKSYVSQTTGTSSAVSKGQIGYIDLDSLMESITFIKNKRKELEAEQKGIETQWENSYRDLEAQKNNFLKRGNSITQQEAEEFQGKLLQQQQVVDERKQNLTRNLSEKNFKFMENIQKQLKDFLTEYNKERNFQYIFTTGTGLDYMVYRDSSLNVTDDVIEGLNEKMKVKE